MGGSSGPIPCEIVVSSWMLTSLADLPSHLPAYPPLRVRTEIEAIDLLRGKVSGGEQLVSGRLIALQMVGLEPIHGVSGFFSCGVESAGVKSAQVRMAGAEVIEGEHIEYWLGIGSSDSV